MDFEYFNVFYCDFSLLPPHITTQILGYLHLTDFKNASSVCKSWYYASSDPTLVKTLILTPKEEQFAEICKSIRHHGILKLHNLMFDKVHDYYFELYEKFGPFVYELHILEPDLSLHHLLKLLEMTTRLELFSITENHQLGELSSLFPSEYDCEAKKRIITNLSRVKTISINHFLNIPMITDLIRCATNLTTLKFTNELCMFHVAKSNPYHDFFSIFDNYDCSNLKDLYLNLYFDGYIDDFITNLVKIENLQLRSFRIAVRWTWKNQNYKSSLFDEFILKLRSVEDFQILPGILSEDQLSIICQHLVDLKRLDCSLSCDQPISELENLTKLEVIHLRFLQAINRYATENVNLIEIDKFFKCKFEHLRVFRFGTYINHSNLKRFCENHPNLIELKLTCLLTLNLEPIFKNLTKLRFLYIYFGLERLPPEIRDIVENGPDAGRMPEYKINHLQDLEELYLSRLVKGVTPSDVSQLKNLRRTNLHILSGIKRKQAGSSWNVGTKQITCTRSFKPIKTQFVAKRD